MPASPAMPIPTISPGEMQLLLSRAGLVLNPGQVADLVLAWRQVAALIASIPHDRPLTDDMALVFRLPPPAVSVTPPSAVTTRPVKRKAQRKVKPKAKAKPVAKRRVSRPQANKGVRRGR